MPQYAYLPPSEIEALTESQFDHGAAERYKEDMEGIFDGIGKDISSVARDVGHFAERAAPVVANIGGAVAGGTGTGANSYAKGPARGTEYGRHDEKLCARQNSILPTRDW